MHRILILPDVLKAGYPVGPDTGYPAIYLAYKWKKRKKIYNGPVHFLCIFPSPFLIPSTHLLLTLFFTFLFFFLSVSFPLFLSLYLYHFLSPSCIFPFCTFHPFSSFSPSFLLHLPCPPSSLSRFPSFSAPFTSLPFLSFPFPSLPIPPLPTSPNLKAFPSLSCPSNYNLCSPSSLTLSTLLFPSLHPSSSPFP